MSPELESYLRKTGWNNTFKWWDKTLNSSCHATIDEKNDGYVYSEDCPDVKMPLEDYFQDIFFDSEEKLIDFLEKYG